MDVNCNATLLPWCFSDRPGPRQRFSSMTQATFSYRGRRRAWEVGIFAQIFQLQTVKAAAKIYQARSAHGWLHYYQSICWSQILR